MTDSPFTPSSPAIALVQVVLAFLLFFVHVDHVKADETSAALKLPVLTGTVRWFNDSKGYGFIVPDDGTDDIYVHHSKIDMEGEGLKTLKKGQHVRFVVTVGPRGKEASNVKVSSDKKPQRRVE